MVEIQPLNCEKVKKCSPSSVNQELDDPVFFGGVQEISSRLTRLRGAPRISVASDSTHSEMNRRKAVENWRGGGGWRHFCGTKELADGSSMLDLSKVFCHPHPVKWNWGRGVTPGISLLLWGSSVHWSVEGKKFAVASHFRSWAVVFPTRGF